MKYLLLLLLFFLLACSAQIIITITGTERLKIMEPLVLGRSWL